MGLVGLGKFITKRISLTQAAVILGVSERQIIFEAIDGKLTAEFEGPTGFIALNQTQLRTVLEYGYVTVGKCEVIPPQSGASHFDRLKSAPDRDKSILRQILLVNILFKDSEIAQYSKNNVLPKSSHNTKQRKSIARLDQMQNTKKRDQAVCDVANQILSSANGEDYKKPNGKIFISKISRHIYKNSSRFKTLGSHTISYHIIRKALAKFGSKRE